MSLADRVRVLGVETVAEGWSVLKRTRLAFRRDDGAWQEMTRETYDRGGAVAVLPYDPERRAVILTRQFRYPVFVAGDEELMIEAPAGMLDGAEPEARARAEALEETGYRLRALTPIFDAFMSPGSVIERIHFFAAPYAPGDRVSGGGGLREEGEDIGVLELPFEEAMAMVGCGGIRDAKTIMLLQHAALHLMPLHATPRGGARPEEAP